MVNVGYNKIYYEGTWELAEALSENAGIRGLDLQRNEISDDGAAHVTTIEYMPTECVPSAGARDSPCSRLAI